MDNIDLRCCICQEEYNLPVALSCGHNFCYLCIKGVVITNNNYGLTKCPLCRTDIDIDMDDCHVNTYLCNEQCESNIVWQYAGRNYGFWDYDNKSCIILEEEYEKYLSNDIYNKCCITIGCNEYIIDFENMEQVLKSDSNKKRSIRRINKNLVDSCTKGTAGISNI